MPKPAAIEANVRTWLRDERQDTLTAYVRVITMSLPNAGSSVSGSIAVADLRVPVEALGRDISDNCRVTGHASALAVSPQSFRVLRLGGFKERVKDIEVEATVDGVTVHHLDHTTGSGLRIRYFVIDLPDGRWMADSHVLVKKNGNAAPSAPASDTFVAALGTRARPITIADG